MALGRIDAQLVVEYGYSGLHPEPMVAIPRPAPFLGAVVGEHGGGCHWQGEGMLYRIAVSEVIVDRTPVMRRVGRGRYVISHMKLSGMRSSSVS